MNDIENVLDQRDTTATAATVARASQFSLAGVLVVGAVFALVFWRKFSR